MKKLLLLSLLFLFSSCFCYTASSFASGNGNLNDTLNNVVTAAKELEEGAIPLSQFIYYVERVYPEDIISYCSDKTPSELKELLNGVIDTNTDSGSTYFYKQIFAGALVSVSVSASSPAWSIWVYPSYNNYSQSAINLAREEAQTMYEDNLALQSQSYISDLKLRLYNNLSSDLRDLASSMIETINGLADEAIAFESSNNAYNLAYAQKTAEAEFETIRKSVALSNPEQMLDLYHYVFLSSPGENSANYYSNEYFINYYKKIYSGAKVSLTISTNSETSISELSYSPSFYLSADWGIWYETYRAEIDNANNDYWNNVAQSKIADNLRELYNSLSSGMSSEELDIAGKCADLLEDYAGAAQNYYSGTLSVYELEIKKFNAQNEIDDLISDASEEDRYNVSLMVIMQSPGTFDYVSDDYPNYKTIYKSSDAGIAAASVNSFTVTLSANKVASDDMYNTYMYLSNNYPDWDAIREEYNQAQDYISKQQEIVRLNKIKEAWADKLSEGIPSSVLSVKQEAIALINSFIDSCNNYLTGKTGVYDLELERLVTAFKINKLIGEVNYNYRGNLTKLILLESEPLLQLWDTYNFQYYKSLISMDNLNAYINIIDENDKYIQSLISSQEDAEVPYVSIYIYNLGDVWQELERAGKDFYLRKQDELVMEDLIAIKSKIVANLSQNAFSIKRKVVDKIELITNLTKNYYKGLVSAEDLEYTTLAARDYINDQLDSLSSLERQNVLWLIIADAVGFHNVLYGETRWEDAETVFLNSADDVDTLHYLCYTINQNEEGPLRIKSLFTRLNDEYRRNFMVSIDCSITVNTFKQISYGCSSDGCSSGQYCYLGDSGSSSNYYTFLSVSPGEHKVCIWTNTPDSYNGEDRYWKADLYKVVSKPVKDVLSLSVITYDNMKIGVEVSAVKKYSKYYYSDSSLSDISEWDLEMSVRYKEITSELSQELRNAYLRYSKERAEEEMIKLGLLRADFEQNINQTLYDLIEQYQAGTLLKSELDIEINKVLSNLSYINNEAVANLGILGNASFPSAWNKISIKISTENVKVMIQEINYLFHSSSNPVRVNYFGDQKAYSSENTNDAQTQGMGMSAKEIERYTAETSAADSSVLYSQGVSNSQADYSYYGLSSSYDVSGFLAQSYVIIKPTEAEISNDVNLIKGKWQNMTRGEAIDMVSRINSAISNNQLLYNLLLGFGDVSLSLSVEHEAEPIFLVSFSTLGGYISDLSYDIKEGAGNNTSNALIKIQYSAIIQVMNYWEENLKYNSNIIQVILKVPGFIGLLMDLFRTEQIIITPASIVLKLTNIFEILNSVGKFVAPSELASSM